ncbi:hypothetical protein KUTeg_009676 [Tegillarca granosa]|uniref:Mannosyltransferase n=1 Tax=Tegillarca granosa TaxID=220873 RepID=A0ABQ9F4K5_TEGGR|nr:hypothetical protein KUTeg_009676 [Tegillarca granosa]
MKHDSCQSGLLFGIVLATRAEVAHSEVYGYGFRPYEYMPPPDGTDNGTSGSVSKAQEYKLGMYSLRSFMFPTIFTIVGKVAVFLGWQKSPYVIWKIFHAAVTSCLPLSVYRFVMVTHASRDIATLATILVASSIHMNVFGTHTFINSFLSPILFYTLSDIMKIILTTEAVQQKAKRSSDEEFLDLYSKSRGVPTESEIDPNFMLEKQVDHNENCRKLNSLQNKNKQTDDRKTGGTAKSSFKRTQFKQKNEQCCYMNGVSMLFIIYSLRGHKELSSVIMHVCHIILKNVTFVRQTSVIRSIILLYIASQWNKFPSYTDNSNAFWSYGKSSDSNYVNICLNYLSEQHDVRGVYIDASIHVTGGYTILHKNVPIISLIHKEFYEFGMDSRILLDKRNRELIPNDTLSLATLRRISDFISIKNTQYLLKVLIKQTVYNYLIIENKREFLKHGYSEVFRSGTMRVLKRNFQPEQEVYLHHIAANIPPGPDVFTLNYEANWLLTYELYDKAEYKLLYSLKNDNKNLQTYQLLIRLYEDQKKPGKAKKMINLCKQYFNSVKCRESPKRIVMHSEYNFDLDI